MQINYISTDKKIKPSKIPTAKKTTHARLIHNQDEFVIDFVEGDTIVERIIQNPIYAKKFSDDLSKAIKDYEEKNGKIKIKKPKQEGLINEMKRNFFFGKKVGKNLRIINPKKRKK